MRFKRSNRSGPTRPAPRIIRVNGGMLSQLTGPRGEPKPVRNFQDPTPLLHLARRGLIAILPAGNSELPPGLPQVSPSELPSVHRHTDPVLATALAETLPLPGGYLPLPPSAQHVNSAVAK